MIENIMAKGQKDEKKIVTPTKSQYYMPKEDMRK